MSSELRLDVRSIPPAQRHPKIFGALESLANGQTLVVLTDHEPRPLRTELESRFGPRIRWGQSHLGEGHWEARIVKLAAPQNASAAETALQRCDAFAAANGATTADIAYYARRVAIKRRHCAVEQGIRWPYVGVVEAGVVQAQLIAPSGHQQAMYDLPPGDLFGEAALFDGGHMLLRYIALTDDTVVLLLPKARVAAALQIDAGLRAGFERAAAQHARSIVERFAEHLSLSSTGRVATALLPYAAPVPGLSDALAPLPTMTQVELAVEAGTAKEVVSRALRELEAMHAIERRGGHLVRLDRDKLLQTVRL